MWLSEIPRFHLDLVDVTIGVVDIASPQASRREFTWIGTRAAMSHLVAPAVRQWKGDVALADARKLRRKIGKMVRDEMDHLAFALDAAVHRHHAGREDDLPVIFEHFRPDDEIGDSGLIFDGDEHDALGGSRHLPDQHHAGSLEPAAIACGHGLGAGDDAPRGEVPAQEGHGVAAQRQADMAVIFDHLASSRHRPECDRWFPDFWDGSGFTG